MVTFSIDVMFIIIKRATRRSVIFQRKLGLIKQDMNVMIRIIIATIIKHFSLIMAVQFGISKKLISRFINIFPIINLPKMIPNIVPDRAT